MLFNEKKEGLELKHHSKYLNVTLESERLEELAVIKAVYSNEVKPISITKLVKLSIDNLVKDLEELPEEKAVEHLKELYKEALF